MPAGLPKISYSENTFPHKTSTQAPPEPNKKYQQNKSIPDSVF